MKSMEQIEAEVIAAQVAKGEWAKRVLALHHHHNLLGTVPPPRKARRAWLWSKLVCPECGSGIEQRTLTVGQDGSIPWAKCLNCEWEWAGNMRAPAGSD